ncbi:MAG: acyl carrier protein [Actinomycetota bacterium]
MDIENQLRSYLVDELQAEADAVTTGAPLISSHVIDSLGMLSIVTFIESEFGIEIGDDELVPDNFETLGSMVKLVESKVASRG